MERILIIGQNWKNQMQNIENMSYLLDGIIKNLTNIH